MDSLMLPAIELQYLETLKEFPGMSRREFASLLIKVSSVSVTADVRKWLALTALPKTTVREVKDGEAGEQRDGNVS